MASDTTRDGESVREIVRDAYGRRAAGGGCCGGGPNPRDAARRVGYSDAELDAVPEGANLGLGCGNPTAMAGLRPGEVVLDLGSGAGFDAFLAAKAVGHSGRVIGVDMTPEMLEKARTHAVSAGVAGQVEFREGLIEDLPVVSESVDLVISNCVINLSADKPKVFREAFRVLKPGGRLAVSDMVLTAALPDEIAKMAEAWVGCISGAMLEREYLAAIEAAGFVDLRTSVYAVGSMLKAALSDPLLRSVADRIGWDAVERAAQSVKSLKVEARRPLGAGA